MARMIVPLTMWSRDDLAVVRSPTAAGALRLQQTEGRPLSRRLIMSPGILNRFSRSQKGMCPEGDEGEFVEESHRFGRADYFAGGSMGFFDRFASKKTTPLPVAPVPEPVVEKKIPVAGAIMPMLATAREKLKANDLPGAMAIYEQVLAGASDRSDVLVTISADLGTNGHVREIIELLTPRFDLEKHGAAAGVNLLQAYLATRNTEAAQHLLDLLFSLQRPELEARLIGFSKALSEIFISETEAADSAPSSAAPAEQKKVNLVSFSKPIWSYGLEAQHGAILPRVEGKLRRVAFAQLSLPGLPGVMELATRPEEDNGRLTRAFALWMAETFSYSAGYEAIAAVGLMDQEHYALFPTEWSTENLRQLSETANAKGLDYIVAGWLRVHNADYELGVRIWEVKKFRELKSFSVRYAPSTANEALLKLHGQLRTYMEWSALSPGNGLSYAPPVEPSSYLQALGASVSLFLGGKNLLSAGQVRLEVAPFVQSARANPQDVRAQLALVTAVQRLKERGAPVEEEALGLARDWLSSGAAESLGLSGIEL